MQTRIVTLAAVLCAGAVGAASLGVGMRIPPITLSDQHDVEGAVRSDTRCVLYSRDMGAAKVVNEVLANAPALLDAAGGVVVSDLSRMPRVITSLFALPALRKRPYRILLDRDGKATADWPFKKGAVTVLFLTDMTIARVDYVDSAETLRAALRQAAATPLPEQRPTQGAS